ncbi:MAG TPA: hypothetical protein VLW50_22175 [Streptosporangiaceae bacterium]|nr:hypothetical protein [Streptosporangiaceae bacterium]
MGAAPSHRSLGIALVINGYVHESSRSTTGASDLTRTQWQTTWLKGGSEPGVLTSAYMATTRTGHSYVVAVLARNPSAPIDKATATPAVLSAVKGAFTLAARRGSSPRG